MLPHPVVLQLSAPCPIATLVLPILHLSASYPRAILSEPVVLNNNDDHPTAILS
jgi:hypothetical protein